MANPFPVLVHEYPGIKPGKVSHAYEHTFPSVTASSAPPKNALLFIGGLYDGPHTVPYPRELAMKLHASEQSGLSYSVFEIRIRSSFTGWGHSSLAKDVEDIDALVRYLRSIGKEKIVLMGHSTGSQDCMEYSNYEKHQNTPVDGFILQGSVSDREGLRPFMGEERFNESLAITKQMVKEGKDADYIPRDKLPSSDYNSPITAYRWHSLIGTGGDDDYFSSDLPDEAVAAIWGRLRQPVLVVPSAEDQYVPKGVDFAKLVARWKNFAEPGIVSEFSGLIPGADHRVNPAQSKEWLADRVVKFLGSLQR